MPEHRDGKAAAGSRVELDQAAREARLAAKLRANLARRKQQGRARDAASPGGPPPALDRDDGDA